MNQSTTAGPPLVRRDQRWMWPQEKLRYQQAVLMCKRLGYYDWYINTHSTIGYNGHGGPSFLPWHRQFLLQFEQQLRAIDSSISLPYWDWTATVDQNNPTPWTESFMGLNGDQVNDGPFRYDGGRGWVCLHAEQPYLQRDFGPANGLPTSNEVAACLKVTPYDSANWDGSSAGFRGSLERGPHATVHDWVGGNMTSIPSAPNDPVFFLHHANIDRIWGLWQQTHPNGYLPADSTPNVKPGQKPGDPMKPWDGSERGSLVKLGAMLDQHTLGYVYDTEEPTAQNSCMLPGDVLRVNESIVSPNGAYRLLYQPTGRLALLDTRSGTVIWQVPDSNQSVGRVVMQTDGNLCVYDAGRIARFATDTYRPEDYGTRLYLTSAGTVETFRMTGQRVKRYPSS